MLIYMSIIDTPYEGYSMPEFTTSKIEAMEYPPYKTFGESREIHVLELKGRSIKFIGQLNKSGILLKIKG